MGNMVTTIISKIVLGLFSHMSYNRPPEDTGPLVEFQTSIVFTGNAALNTGALTITSHTDALYSVDLLEIAYDTNEAALDASLPTLRWRNGELSNDSGGNRRPLVVPNIGGQLYFMEYNRPVNLYKFNGAKHRAGSQLFELELVRRDGNLLNTSLVRMRLMCSYYAPQNMVHNPSILSKILNAPT